MLIVCPQFRIIRFEVCSGHPCFALLLYERIIDFGARALGFVGNQPRGPKGVSLTFLQTFFKFFCIPTFVNLLLSLTESLTDSSRD